MMHPQLEPSLRAAVSLPDRVLIVKSDRFYSQCLQLAVARLRPNSSITIANRISEAEAFVASCPPYQLVVSGVGFPEGDALPWLGDLAKSHRVGRVLVVTTRAEMRVLTALRSLPIDGVFDAFNAEFDEFSHALTQVLDGGYFLSPSFAERLRSGSDSIRMQVRNLSRLEQRVLTFIGTGADNVEAARLLGMTASAVQSHRKRLHHKLGVAHKGELIRETIRMGLVRVDRDGNLRIGFGSIADRRFA